MMYHVLAATKFFEKSVAWHSVRKARIFPFFLSTPVLFHYDCTFFITRSCSSQSFQIRFQFLVALDFESPQWRALSKLFPLLYLSPPYVPSTSKPMLKTLLMLCVALSRPLLRLHPTPTQDPKRNRSSSTLTFRYHHPHFGCGMANSRISITASILGTRILRRLSPLQTRLQRVQFQRCSRGTWRIDDTNWRSKDSAESEGRRCWLKRRSISGIAWRFGYGGCELQMSSYLYDNGRAPIDRGWQQFPA